jgi:lipopolysaccharide biosynthesis regulator YciM
LTNAYIAKYGYDDFVGNVVSKALELYPNSISANMIKANLLTMEFEYVCNQVGINPRNKQELQNIRYYPKVVEMLNAVNAQYATIDNLGYTHMPAEAYQDWLQSMKKQESLQENQKINEQFKGLLNKQPIKN